MRATSRASDEGTRRLRPRLWHHDYLHLRPLVRDLQAEIAAARAAAPLQRVLDVGCGPSPYRSCFGDHVRYVRADLDAAWRPDVIARGEALPFVEKSFDGIISSQVLPLVQDPAAVVAEMVRVTRPGGRLWISTSAAWPDDSAVAENRFGEPDLRRLFAATEVLALRRQGGMLALPFAIANHVVREVVRASRRRFGAAAAWLRLPAAVIFVIMNLAGRLLERLRDTRALRAFLGFLDRRLPMNWLVVARRPAVGESER